MIYLTSAFSLGMLSGNATIHVKELQLEEVRKILSHDTWDSAIGHEGTSLLLSRMLGTDVRFNRASLKLNPGDSVLVFQLQTRLPEGAVLSDEEVQQLPHKWYLATVE